MKTLAHAGQNLPIFWHWLIKIQYTVPDRQQCVHFRKLQKVVNHSTLLFIRGQGTVLYYYFKEVKKTVTLSLLTIRTPYIFTWLIIVEISYNCITVYVPVTCLSRFVHHTNRLSFFFILQYLEPASSTGNYLKNLSTNSSHHFFTCSFCLSLSRILFLCFYYILL